MEDKYWEIKDKQSKNNEISLEKGDFLYMQIEELRNRLPGQVQVPLDNPLAKRIRLLEEEQSAGSAIIFDGSDPAKVDIYGKLTTLSDLRKIQDGLTELRLKKLASNTLSDSLRLFFENDALDIEEKLTPISASLEIWQFSENSFTRDWSEEGILPEHIIGLKEICQLLEIEETNAVSVRDYLQAYRQYFEFFLWRISEIKKIPDLSEQLVTTSLYQRLPDELKDFHTKRLPQTWISLLEEEEKMGFQVSSPKWHRVFREKSRREMVASWVSGVDSNAHYIESELMTLRRGYAATAEILGIGITESVDDIGQKVPELSMPDLNQAVEYLYEGMRKTMGDRDAVTLIMGISGDLDSSAQLALLSEVIKKYGLPYTIHAYYLKKDHHNSRFRRINELIDHINNQKSDPIVQLHVYEGMYAYELMLQELVTESREFLKPNSDFALKAVSLIVAAAQESMDKMGVIGEDAERRHRKAGGIAKPTTEIEELAALLGSEPTMKQIKEFFSRIKGDEDNIVITSDQILNLIGNITQNDQKLRISIEESFDKREQSNLIHEMLIAIRGNLCRKYDYPITVSAQQLSEITTENFTTSDTFVSWFPFAKIPKTVIAHIFKEYILQSNGGISLNEWKKFPMKYLVPYYPDFMQISETNGRKIISRNAWFIQEFDRVEVDVKSSGIPEEVWDEIKQVDEKNYIKVDGRILWYLDPYLHYFLINGLSEKSVNELQEKYPARKTDIQLTAFLLSGAREKKQKDLYMMKTANFR
ncbi:hypothetical protein A3D05_01860 [Candidatus Gottesmanbacteria bacterium RIFCSPHIGHO2_02_FULL_40_24]|nr:MAG: hypothetical protein A3D05_01860 [Candidatus Gottesmanbacteria bacterium RIFCSPHIGHO2_02_FULL_40_24]